MSEAFRLQPHEWALLRTLLDEALALPPGERAAWLERLDETRAGQLKPRLASLLAHAGDGTAARLMETLPRVETGQFAPGPGAAGDPGEAAGSTVGPWRLVRELGSGGMGSVWLAERTDLLQGRQVALKLPHAAGLVWKRAGLAERLAREREILATLEHPNIARLYDAGVSADGQPWLALEYVAGVRIDHFCAERQLGVRERVALFGQVVRAVAHAHAHLVVHRDLKPANILVTASGEVKLLDFGIAKIVAEGVVQETELTREAGRALTPEYASPEQLLGQALGTASDVYSLGVVLFELLADTRPHAPGGSRAALEAAVSAGIVPRPSTVAPAGRRAALRGELDTIVLKALKREPAERYATVAALADDLERFLTHRPVLAQPDSAWYRLRTFVRRHRVAVGAGGAVAAALVAGVAVAGWQARVALDERDRATQVRAFIESMFREADPHSAAGGPATVVGLLQQARQRVDRELAGRPDLQVEMLRLIGNNLLNLHEREAALATLDEAVAIGRRALPPDHPSTLQARVTRLGAWRSLARRAELEAEFGPLVAALRAQPRLVEPLIDALREQSMLAWQQQRRPEEGARLAQEALDLARRHLGEHHRLTADAAVMLAGARDAIGRPEETLPAAETALQIALAVRGEARPHLQVITARLMLARARRELGDLRSAAALFHACVADSEALYGRRSVEAALTGSGLSRVWLDTGEATRALERARLDLDVLAEKFGGPTLHVPTARSRVGQALLALARESEAVPVLREALGEFVARGAAAHPQARGVREDLALALAQSDRRAEAEQVLDALRQAPAAAASAPAVAVPASPREWAVRSVLHRLGGQADEAERTARLAVEAAVQAASASRRPAVGEIARLGVLPELAAALLAGRKADAALAAYDEILALAARHHAADSALRARAWLGRGQALALQGRSAEAVEPVERAVAFWRTAGADPRWGRQADEVLAALRGGQPSVAAAAGR